MDELNVTFLSEVLANGTDKNDLKSVKNNNKAIISNQNKNINIDTEKNDYFINFSSMHINDRLNQNSEVKELFNHIYNLKGKILYYSKSLNSIGVILNKSGFLSMVKQDYPHFFTMVSFKDNAKMKEIFYPGDDILDIATYLNQINEVTKKTNLFQKESIKIEKIDNALVITNNSIFIAENLDLSNIELNIQNDIINDYLNHFKEFRDVLDWIVALRFCSNRRTSYLHLRVDAGWGKSFFLQILKNTNVGVGIDYSDFQSPSPLDSSKILNKLAIMIDEFTIFKKEFKNITNEWTLASKFGLNETIEVGAKIFASAEESPSFENGVDSQISDRICQINKHNIKPLDTREIRIKYKAFYLDVLSNYARDILRERIAYYVSLGDKYKAEEQAERVVESFYKTYKLKAENLNKIIFNKFFDTIKEMIVNDGLDKELRNIADNIKGDGTYIYIKSLSKVYDTIIKSQGDSFYSKAKYKTVDIVLGKNAETKTYRMDGKVFKAFRISEKFLDDVYTRKIDSDSVNALKYDLIDIVIEDKRDYKETLNNLINMSTDVITEVEETEDKEALLIEQEQKQQQEYNTKESLNNLQETFLKEFE